MMGPREVRYDSLFNLVGGSVKSFVNRKLSDDLMKKKEFGSPKPDNQILLPF